MSRVELTHTLISFPDIKAHASAGHKLRGYISSLVKNEDSHFFHNHNAEGKEIYRYPVIQYKVINKIPCIVGINAGSALLAKLFLNIKELTFDNISIPVHSKTISQSIIQPSVNEGLFTYRFETMWMGLNQKNYLEYKSQKEEEKNAFLNRCLANNILSFYKGIGFNVESRILVKSNLNEHMSSFKNQPILVFSGSFTTNAFLPDFIGIGKSVSRGFGAVKKIS